MDSWWKDSHLDSNTKYYLHIEASTKCNAACPFCARFLGNSPNVNPSLNLIDLTVNKLDSWLGPSIISKVDTLLFCGNFGEPIVNRNLEDILNYIAEINPDIDVYFSTNGGARNSKFWINLAKILKKFRSGKVVFSIDGLEDTNHLYRRNVIWDKVIKNAKTFIDAGGHAEWQYLVFKHNQHQTKEAEDISKKLGFKLFTLKNPMGLEDVASKTFFSNPVHDKKGNLLYTIEQADKLIRPDFEYIGLRDVQPNSQLDAPFPVSDFSFDPSKYDYLDSYDIKCSVASSEQYKGLYLTADGHFFPCCWLGYYSQIEVKSDFALDLYSKIGGRNGCNLNLYTFEEIFKKWDYAFVASWLKSVKKGKCLVCSSTCGIQDPDYIFSDEKLNSIDE